MTDEEFVEDFYHVLDKDGYTRFTCFICGERIRGTDRVIPHEDARIVCHAKCCPGFNIQSRAEQACVNCVTFFGNVLRRAGN